MEKIKELTPEQKAEMVVWRKRWFDIGSCCDPADKPKAEAAISKMYELIGQTAPKFIWCKSPLDANREIHRYSKGLPADHSLEGEDIEIQGAYQWGQMDSYWISFYLFCRDVVGVEYSEKDSETLDLWSEIAQSCGWWWPYEGVCFVSDRPLAVHWEDDRDPPRIHNPNGPAVEYRDGFKVYAIRDIRVEPRIIENPETITFEEILRERNAEIRRVLLRQYGEERFVNDSRVKMFAQDEEGILYSIDGEDIDFMLLKVINSTPEPDGSLKPYFLTTFTSTETTRENTGIDYHGPWTPHAARAISFKIHPDKFNCLMET